MINVFHKNRNTIGNLAIALLLLGGCVFILTGSWNSPETVAASSCCGGGATATTLAATTTGGCCGGTNRLSDSEDYNCNCLDTDDADADCGACSEDANDADSECNGDTQTQTCTTDCARTYCGESGSFCNSDDFETVCSKDNDGKFGCEGDADGCSKETN